MASRGASDEAGALRDRVVAAFGDRYIVGHELGRGGTSVVYAAEEVRLGRQVALKVLLPEASYRPDLWLRFLREAQTAARLNHPHIVPVLAVHEEPGLACFVMGLVHGESLTARLLREPLLPFPVVARILEQVADALAYAHASGVVHRDIKPDNILLDEVAGNALVTDFGIARAREHIERLTQTGMAMGTPVFMSPEQATGDREIDGRSDLYGLGVVGYLMLTGRVPFEAPSPAEVLAMHLSATVRPVLSLRPECPPSLAAIIEQCLQKRPEDRWPSALVLRDALRRVRRDGHVQQTGAAPSVPTIPTTLPTPAIAPAAPGTAAPGTAAPGTAAPGTARMPAAASADEHRMKAEQAVERFRGHLVRTVIWSLMMLLINAFTSPQFPWFVFPVGAFWMKLWRRRRRLDRYGLTWRQLLRLDPLPAAPITMADRLAQLAPPAVLASPHGAAVRQALENRLAIADVTAQLTSTDRGLVPDVDATADALVTRISMLTATLEQLDRHLAGDSPAQFATRLAVLAADDPQRELLHAQQTAWEQLHAQRADLQRQRESASLALRTLCFDVLKLRTMGVGAASDSVQRATQEARAVSADIARVLQAAEEVRRL